MNLATLLKEYAAPASATSGLAGYSLEGQRDAGFKRALQLALARKKLLKGDVEGHEFHGNQWTGGGGPAEENLAAYRVATGEYNKVRTEVAPLREKLEYYEARQSRFGGPKNAKEAQAAADLVNQIHEYEPRLRAAEAKMIVARERVYPKQGRDVPFNNPVASSNSPTKKSEGTVRTVALVPGGLAKLLTDRAAQLKPRLLKGDVPGHEFHGNQWIDGSTGEIPTYRSKDGAPVIKQPLKGSVAERRGIKVGSMVNYNATSMMGEALSGHGRVVGFVPNKSGYSGNYKGGVTQDVVMRDEKRGSFMFIEDRNVRISGFKKVLTDRAAHQAATSYLNLKPQPTEAQRHAGNYPKGHVVVGGLDISIENPAGSRRRPEWPALQSHYGYIRRTEGADGDHVDCFVRQGTPEDYAGPVYVIDQKIEGAFDEHKVMVGWTTEEEARAAYLVNHDRGWDGVAAITQLSIKDFKAWLAEGDTTKPLQSGGNSLSRLLLSTVRRFA